VQLEPAVLPSYTIPPSVDEKSVLGLSARTLSASQLLLAPLPPLVTGLFPRTGTSLHGERLGDLPSVYERIGPRRHPSKAQRLAQDPPLPHPIVSESAQHEDAVLTAWYSQAGVLDLAWLNHPSRHHVRWRQPEGRWVMAKRRFSGGEALARHLAKKPPADLYVSTSAWLDPVNLPGLRDETRPSPVLLDHLVVFDLDLGPFSMKRLETVRKRTSNLITWLDEHTNLVLLHVTFSGAKGFHVVLRDPDRTPFELPDPREREQAVREHRQRLLERVMAAGHAVDPTVTADTRRIIRVPGSLHGRTRWACTVLGKGLIQQPLRRWVDALPRASDAQRMPKRPPREAKERKTKREKPPLRAERLTLEVSTHVVGTKDRTAVVALLPNKVDDQRLEAFLNGLPEDVAPLGIFDVGQRFLVVVPRAFPRARAMAVFDEMGLKAVASRHRADEHAWIPLLESTEESLEGITPRGWSRLEDEVGHPWSRPHLELCHRLGLDAPPSTGDVSGSAEPALRFAKRR